MYANIRAVLRQKRFWLGALISIVLLAYFFYQKDLNSIGAALARANYFFLIPALLLYFVGVALRAVRWHFLLHAIRAIPVRELFPVVVIGYMANDILPFRIGELVRAFVLGQNTGISKASILVTIFVERLFDGLTMVAFIAGASYFLPIGDDLKAKMVFGSVVFIGIMLLLVLVATLRERLDQVIHFIISHLPRHWGEHGTRLIHSFLHGLSVLRHPVDAPLAFVFSIAAWLCEAGMYLVVARGFGIQLPYPVFVLATSVANLFTIAPSTPGFIGVLDAPLQSVLILFGVEGNLATSYTLVLHAALFIPVTLLGFFYAWRAGLNLTQLSHPTDVSIETTA